MATGAAHKAGETVNEPSGQQVALVKSAVPLDDTQKAMILQRLRSRFGPQIRGQFEVDPTLLGGVQARVGDQLIDDSVAWKLEVLRDILIKSGEAE